MTCRCGHGGNNHLFSGETEHCLVFDCHCTCFNEATEELPVTPKHQRYLDQLDKVEDKVRYILENIPESKDMKNKDFVFLYWHLVSKLNIISNDVIKTLDDPESIMRCRQLLVQHNREKYGGVNHEYLTEKALKESATYSYVLEKYLT